MASRMFAKLPPGSSVNGGLKTVLDDEQMWLLGLLEQIDVVNSAVEDRIVLEAMICFGAEDQTIARKVSFDNVFGEYLTLESSFMVKSFNDFCRQEGKRKFESTLEEKMPAVTKLLCFLQRYKNDLMICVLMTPRKQAKKNKTHVLRIPSAEIDGWEFR